MPAAGAAPRLTVVVTTYERPNYLADCLASIAAQTFRDFRLVVLDNGSSADYTKVIADFRGGPIEYIRRPENVGASGNIIGALADFGQSDYLMVFHDDDLMHPRMLERLMGALEDCPECAFAAAEYVVFEDGASPSGTSTESGDARVEQIPDSAELARLFMRHTPLGFGSAVYRRSALRVISPDFGVFNMYWDRPFLLDAAEHGGCVVATAPLMFYRFHEAQDSRSDVLTPDIVMALMESFRGRLPQPLATCDAELFVNYSSHFLSAAYAMMTDANRPPLIRYLANARRRGLLSLRSIERGDWLTLMRAAGLGALLDVGVSLKRLARGRRTN